jgi:hypothetical protein
MMPANWPVHRPAPGLRVWLAPGLDPALWLPWLLERARLPREEHGGTALQVGRNVVSRHQLGPHDIALKDFGLRHLQPLIYALRSSKAARAALAAQRLHALGLRSPAPLALLEQRRCRLLRRAFLVCEFIPDCVTLRCSLNDTLFPPATFLPELGRIARRLHEADCWHADLTAANVLLEREEPARMWLIDINRLRHRRLCAEARWRNLGQLSLPDDLWPLLLEGYCPEEDATRRQAIQARLIHHHRLFRDRGLRKRQRRLAKRGNPSA